MIIYCRDQYKQTERSYQYIHPDLVEPINPIEFVGEQYFFMFIDNVTRITDIYTGISKSDGLKYLKAYHKLCQTHSQNSHSIKQLRLNYESELQSHKPNK